MLIIGRLCGVELRIADTGLLSDTAIAWFATTLEVKVSSNAPGSTPTENNSTLGIAFKSI